MPYVKALIRDETKYTWHEIFYVDSIETAEHEVVDIVAHFNATLRDGESMRYLVKVETKEVTYEIVKQYLRDLLSTMAREKRNAFGEEDIKRNYPKYASMCHRFLSVKKPNKQTYRSILKFMEMIPQSFRDEQIFDYLSRSLHRGE